MKKLTKWPDRILSLGSGAWLWFWAGAAVVSSLFGLATLRDDANSFMKMIYAIPNVSWWVPTILAAIWFGWLGLKLWDNEPTKEQIEATYGAWIKEKLENQRISIESDAEGQRISIESDAEGQRAAMDNSFELRKEWFRRSQLQQERTLVYTAHTFNAASATQALDHFTSARTALDAHHLPFWTADGFSTWIEMVAPILKIQPLLMTVGDQAPKLGIEAGDLLELQQENFQEEADKYDWNGDHDRSAKWRRANVEMNHKHVELGRYVIGASEGLQLLAEWTD